MRAIYLNVLIVELIFCFFIASESRPQDDTTTMSPTTPKSCYSGYSRSIVTSKVNITVRNHAMEIADTGCFVRDRRLGAEIAPNESFTADYELRGNDTAECVAYHLGYMANFFVRHNKSDPEVQNFDYEIKKGGLFDKNGKVRSLSFGKHFYELRLHRDSGYVPHKMKGTIDPGECNNFPLLTSGFLLGFKTCHKSCIQVYKDVECRGNYQEGKDEQSKGCKYHPARHDTEFSRVRSVKGC